MIRLIAREDALYNAVFASHIGKWQMRYDPSVHPYMTTPGVYYDWDLDKQRYYGQSEIDQINKSELDIFLHKKDNISIIEHPYFGELIYNLPGCDIFTYCFALGKVLEKLAIALQSPILFMLDYAVPWLYQKNQYTPVAKAIDYFQSIGVSEDFCGAIQCTGQDLVEFTGHLFWIIRCNASLPYCWFSTDKDDFVGDICKHGNIHFHAYAHEIKTFLEEFSNINALLKIEQCIDGFHSDGTIQGRQILIQ